MLTLLTLKSKTESELKWNTKLLSAMQGVLMERLDSEYAEFLHSQRVNPYSQHLVKKDPGHFLWNISTLTQTAYENIIKVFMSDDFSGFHIKSFGCDFHIEEKCIETETYKKLTKDFYQMDSNRYINIRFLTPTSFKSAGRYIYHPDMRLIFQSLMLKYNSVTEGNYDVDDDMLTALCESGEIQKYNLRSIYYYIGKAKIPAFLGEITVKMSGTQSLVNYANMLFRFAAYSGIGIKTSMGMGGINIIREKE